MVPQQILWATSLALFAASGQNIEHALRMICPDGKISGPRDGEAIGCRGCPAGTLLVDVPGLRWDLHHAIMGHFTSPIAWNVLLTGIGCERIRTTGAVPSSSIFGAAYLAS